MEREIKNKVVVVTGGAEGIGYEIADKCLAQQAEIVVILDINEVKGAEAVKNLNSNHDGTAVFLKCDITKDLEAVSNKIFETYRQVDVLINNAGIVDESSARRTLELNTIALIEWSMKFWKHMRRDKGGNGGTIINIGSVYSFTVDPYLVFYKASKFAVLGFTTSLGHMDNYKNYGVRLATICPGFTHSTLTAAGMLCWTEQLDIFEEFLKTQQWQRAEEVGKAVVAVFQTAESGTTWKIVGGELSEFNFSTEVTT